MLNGTLQPKIVVLVIPETLGQIWKPELPKGRSSEGDADNVFHWHPDKPAALLSAVVVALFPYMTLASDLEADCCVWVYVHVTTALSHFQERIIMTNLKIFSPGKEAVVNTRDGI